MNITEYFIEKNIAQVKVELTSEEVNQRIKKAYESVNLQSTLPGFRKGKAPVNVLKNRIPLSELQNDILEDIAKEAMNYFLNEKKEEDFIDYPYLKTIEPLHEDQPYQITFFADIYPKVTPAETADLSFDIKGVPSAEKIAQDKINALLDTHATYLDLDNPEPDGYAIIEYAFTDQKDPSFVQSPKTQMIRLTEDGLQPGLNEKIMKQSIGSFQFYPVIKKEGEPDKFIYVKVIAWKKKEIPQFNQEFLDSIQANIQIDLYQEEVNKEAENEYKENVKEQTMDKVIEYLVNKSTFEVIPDNLYQHYLKDRLEEMEREIEKLKISWEKYLEITKKTQEEVEKELEPRVMNQIKVDMLFRHFAKNHPELSPSEEELNKRTTMMMESFKQSKQTVSKEKVMLYVKDNLIKGNIIEWLIKDVKVNIKSS